VLSRFYFRALFQKGYHDGAKKVKKVKERAASLFFFGVSLSLSSTSSSFTSFARVCSFSLVRAPIFLSVVAFFFFFKYEFLTSLRKMLLLREFVVHSLHETERRRERTSSSSSSFAFSSPSSSKIFLFCVECFSRSQTRFALFSCLLGRGGDTERDTERRPNDKKQ